MAAPYTLGFSNSSRRGRIEPVEMPLKPGFYVLTAGIADFRLRAFGISIALFHRASSQAFRIRSV